MSGYDMRAVVMRSTSFFWNAGYGQLYPELRRLAERGWVTTKSSPSGDRRRLVHTLTRAGDDALQTWLADGETTVALRDENLLRLFFADGAPEPVARRILEDRRDGHLEYAEALAKVAAETEPDGPYGSLPLLWGRDFHAWGAAWCESQLERLAS